MKRIGLIGGMSWESTLIYYRLLNQGVRERLGGLHSADIVLHSLDFEQVVRLQKAGDWDRAGDLLARSGTTLARAGADMVLICTNTMHLLADRVADASGLPLVNIIHETGRAIAAAGCRRPLLLATRYTMEHGFYADAMRNGAGVDVMVPDAHDRATAHAVIFEELCHGIVREPSRRRMLDIVARGVEQGADAVILGCTEICLLLDPDALPVPGFDSTAIHTRAALDAALVPQEVTRWHAIPAAL